MDGSLPLPTPLTQVLVAFTIEFDNEGERRIRHRTTRHGGTRGPWLASLVMWSDCMQFIDDEGLPVRELERRARTRTNLAGMERWGYVSVEPDPADHRPKPPRSSWLVRATDAGRRAQEIWRPLFSIIEERWQDRFGKDEMEKLQETLAVVASQLDLDLPDCMPILGYGLFSKGREFQKREARRENGGDARLPLAALLARVLLAFAIDFEMVADLSLAISANVVRVLDEKGVRVRELPRLSGVSKEAIAMALGFLTKRGYAVVAADKSASRTKVVRLTRKGQASQEAYWKLLSTIQKRWRKNFGNDTIRALRESLGRLVGEGTPLQSPLFRGLEPYPDGWRASVRRPQTSPHFPMVLHRGGYPDGS